MSQLEVDKIIPQSGTTLTIGDSGDTISFGSGTTPQLGGNLDLNSNDITGTGNINITGNITASGNLAGTLTTASQPNITSVGTLTSATVSGDLTVDTNTLYVDSGNNRVGIGTSSPESGLHLFDGTNVNTPQNTGRKSTLIIEGGSETADLQFLTSANYNHIFFGDSADANIGTIVYDHTNNSLQIGTNASERMRIDSSGNVGIGTSSPSGKLDVVGDIYWGSQGNGRIFSDSNWGCILQADRVSPGVATFNFSDASGTELMRIGPNGHLYATCNDGTFTNLTLRNGASGDVPDYLQCRDSANNLELVIEADGDVKNTNNSYGAVSDQKLKENIVDASSQWEDIKSLRVRKYNLIGSDNLHLGVVAQELETAGMNGLVKETVDKDSEGNDLGTTTKSVKYSILYMKAVKALQEAMQKIEDLEARVNTLEGN